MKNGLYIVSHIAKSLQNQNSKLAVALTFMEIDQEMEDRPNNLNTSEVILLEQPSSLNTPESISSSDQQSQPDQLDQPEHFETSRMINLNQQNISDISQRTTDDRAACIEDQNRISILPQKNDLDVQKSLEIQSNRKTRKTKKETNSNPSFKPFGCPTNRSST
ncbi:hypothetical protein K3495_g8411 [Podosphaera aphanis]|nr:hypothetical protein K3495_g8411 [Podosphaera aphanis]